jgi:protein involved in polysaccharide export with SLBB domain
MTSNFLPRRLGAWLLFSMLAIGLGLAAPASAQNSAADPSQSMSQTESGPLRLRQPVRTPDLDPPEASEPRAVAAPYVPGEFERFVQVLANGDVRRLGAELVTGSAESRAGDLGASVPPEYVLAPGDEVLLLLWGSVDADLRLVVDRAGRISVPRVGTIQVAGVRYGDLPAVVERRVAQIFKNFQLSVSLGQLRGIRVFVTGFVLKPGTYTVSALSTVVGALMRAGGPSAAGSFRQVELKRGGSLIARLDLYDLLLRGDRSADRLIQAGDVVHVGPVGTQAAVIGSVNRAVVVEMAQGEGVAQALAMAGGFSAVADRSRVAIERLQERTSQRVAELALPRDAALPLNHGDVLRAFSATEAVLSTQRQNKRVRVDGEVQRPGEYVLAPNSTLQDALRAAGGLAPSAFIYGTQFTRESVRATQQENYERALRDLETDFARASGTQRVSSSDQAVQSQAQAQATSRLIDRLRSLKPSGRVVLQLAPTSQELPQLALEDGDRLYVPPRPTTVGVFGSVFNTGSYIYSDGRSLGDYLRLAGGPTKGADEDSIFVVRSNGQVVSGRQSGGGSWFSTSKIGAVSAEPGDTVFVPEEMDKTTFVQAAKDWTQILYQFGIGLAGIKSAVQ